MPSPEVCIRFAGHDWLLDARRAVYWPAEETLIVSDLHLEKSTFLSHFGHFIPPYDSHDTLLRLEALIAHYRPKRLLLLGDSFHDRQAFRRLAEPTRLRLLALIAGLQESI